MVIVDYGEVVCVQQFEFFFYIQQWWWIVQVVQLWWVGWIVQCDEYVVWFVELCKCGGGVCIEIVVFVYVYGLCGGGVVYGGDCFVGCVQ